MRRLYLAFLSTFSLPAASTLNPLAAFANLTRAKKKNMDKREPQLTLYDLRAKAAIEQAKGHIQRANSLVSEGMRRIDPEIRDDPKHNPFLGIRMKLLFQTRYWDPVLFDPDKAITQAIVSPSPSGDLRRGRLCKSLT